MKVEERVSVQRRLLVGTKIGLEDVWKRRVVNNWWTRIGLSNKSGFVGVCGQFGRAYD